MSPVKTTKSVVGRGNYIWTAGGFRPEKSRPQGSTAGALWRTTKVQGNIVVVLPVQQPTLLDFLDSQSLMYSLGRTIDCRLMYPVESGGKKPLTGRQHSVGMGRNFVTAKHIDPIPYSCKITVRNV